MKKNSNTSKLSILANLSKSKLENKTVAGSKKIKLIPKGDGLDIANYKNGRDKINTEDEENNYYSIAEDNYHVLEEKING